MYLVDLGINQAKQVLLIADGAEWIWKHIPSLLQKLGCQEETYQLLDFYHATEHLQSFADNSFSQEIERKQWFKQARSSLKKGNINILLQEMNKLSLNFSGERRKNLDKEINYFIKANEAERLNYHKIASLKLPIGSGAVESLTRKAEGRGQRAEGISSLSIARTIRATKGSRGLIPRLNRILSGTNSLLGLIPMREFIIAA